LVAPLELIPKHELLSESEAKEISKKYNTTIERFPKINESDPQAKKLDAKPGQLIQIHREGQRGKYLFYRFVVKG
jgi:DNA-directed RNA polymerase subunit H